MPKPKKVNKKAGAKKRKKAVKLKTYEELQAGVQAEVSKAKAESVSAPAGITGSRFNVIKKNAGKKRFLGLFKV